MNGVMWAILSEWDEVNAKVKALVSSGLFVTNWEAFISSDYSKEEKECLMLDEYGLRGMSGELEES